MNDEIDKPVGEYKRRSGTVEIQRSSIQHLAALATACLLGLGGVIWKFDRDYVLLDGRITVLELHKEFVSERYADTLARLDKTDLETRAEVREIRIMCQEHRSDDAHSVARSQIAANRQAIEDIEDRCNDHD